jgi:predicted HicB family RNase H-like nuclease
MDNETRTTLRIPAELKEKLAKEAEEQNRSVHNLIITILQEYFRK